MIQINCEAKDTLRLEELTEFQGGLKVRENADFEKIERSIRKHGFSFPFFVWKHDGINYVLDGHGRLGALNRMVAGGEQVPALPVVYVNCKDEPEAKEILLKLNSTYGHMTAESVKEFIGDLDIEIEDIALPDGYLDLNVEIEDSDEGKNEEADETNLGDPNFNYKSQYGVIVMCQSEQEQENVYNQLLGMGFTCKVVTV